MTDEIGRGFYIGTVRIVPAVGAGTTAFFVMSQLFFFFPLLFLLRE